MKHSIKKLSILTCVLALAVVASGCSRSGSERSGSEYVQTHQHDDVTKLSAKMHQLHGKRQSMGSIKFSEKDGGLSMRTDLENARPNTEYEVSVFEVKDCKPDKARGDGNCQKKRKNIDLPKLKSDAQGNIKSTYLIKSVTAAELDNLKIVLSRTNEQGAKVEAVGGMLKERMLF